MGYVYVKIFLGTPVHQGASLLHCLAIIGAGTGLFMTGRLLHGKDAVTIVAGT